MEKKQSVIKIAEFLKENYNIDNFQLPEEYNYSCLPLCILDAIFSIGVNYKSVENVVSRFCEKNSIEKYGTQKQEYTISEFCRYIESIGIDSFKNDILQNRQLTSSISGIPKAEAVYQVADLFKNNGIETKSDFNTKLTDEIESEYKNIKGQTSGISLNYLKMLAGCDDLVKPDRHIMNFFIQEYGFDISKPCQAQTIIDDVTNELKKEFKDITQRKVDYMIWKYMSSK